MLKIPSLLFTCEHPKHIITKDNRKMIVSCGKCLSCLVQKARSKAGVCQEQEKLSKFTFFVTLTYSPLYVPKAYCVFSNDGGRQVVDMYDVETGELIGSKYYSHKLTKQIISRSDDGYLHYSRYSDLQKFIKRLRRLISYYNISDEKISYYAVSEYGPRTFRPHFHVLFYFDDPKIAEVFNKFVDKAWPFGHNSSSLSRGGCTSYVASYVNSSTTLPELFKTSATNAKSSHSSCLGISLDSQELAQIYKNEPKRFVRIVERKDSDGNVSLSSPWRSYRNYLFPKCYGYTFKSSWERLCTYSALQTVIARYGERKIVDYVDLIINDFYNETLPYTLAVALLTPAMEGYILPTRDILLSRLYQSKHFFNLCVKFDLTPKELSNNIDVFYSSLDYQNLVEMYGLINESEHILSPADYEMFSKSYAYGTQMENVDFVEFNGIMFEPKVLKELYDKSSLYQYVLTSRKTAYQKSIKHKELNDLNKIFDYHYE